MLLICINQQKKHVKVSTAALIVALALSPVDDELTVEGKKRLLKSAMKHYEQVLTRCEVRIIDKECVEAVNRFRNDTSSEADAQDLRMYVSAKYGVMLFQTREMDCRDKADEIINLCRAEGLIRAAMAYYEGLRLCMCCYVHVHVNVHM